MFKKKEKISSKAISHSSLGEFSKGDKKHSPRFLSGGHGEENIQELKKGEYNIISLSNIPMEFDWVMCQHINNPKKEREAVKLGFPSRGQETRLSEPVKKQLILYPINSLME